MSTLLEAICPLKRTRITSKVIHNHVWNFLQDEVRLPPALLVIYLVSDTHQKKERKKEN